MLNWVLTHWWSLVWYLAMSGLLLWWGPWNQATGLVGVFLVAVAIAMIFMGWAIIAWAVLTGRSNLFHLRR